MPTLLVIINLNDGKRLIIWRVEMFPMDRIREKYDVI